MVARIGSGRHAIPPLLEAPIPFGVPEEARFEHCHIIGGTGPGKDTFELTTFNCRVEPFTGEDPKADAIVMLWAIRPERFMVEVAG